MNEIMETLARLREAGEPIVLMIGRRKVVVRGFRCHQKLEEVLEAISEYEGVREGIEGMKAGRTLTLDQCRAHAKKRGLA